MLLRNDFEIYYIDSVHVFGFDGCVGLIQARHVETDPQIGTILKGSFGTCLSFCWKCVVWIQICDIRMEKKNIDMKINKTNLACQTCFDINFNTSHLSTPYSSYVIYGECLSGKFQ